MIWLFPSPNWHRTVEPLCFVTAARFAHEMVPFFVEASTVVATQMLEHPLRCRVVHATLRRALLPRFPYCIFYRVDQDHVVVLAALHGSRDPSDRLDRRP